MEQQYTRITTSLFEAIQKVTSGASEQKQEVLSEEKKEEQIDEAIHVPPVSHVSPRNPTNSSKDDDNRKASSLIDKIRSYRSLKQDYKEKGNLERHKEFHAKLLDADKEYQKLGHKSLLRKDDHISEDVALDEAKGLASMTVDQLKQEHEKVKNKIEAEGKSKMISMNHPLSQRARLIKLHMMIKNKQANEEVEETNEAKSHQAATTMKHIKPGTLKQNYGDKQDAANIKPGISGVADRLAMLARAKKEGRLKEEVEQMDEISNKLAASYMTKSSRDLETAELGQKIGAAHGADDYVAQQKHREKKRLKGIGRAVDRLGKEPKNEEVDQFDETIIKEDLNIEIPEQFTFQDYLVAVNNLVGNELEEHEVVAVAYEAFRQQEEEIILEELTRDDLKQKMKAHMDAGHQISGEKFNMKDGKPYGEYVVTDKETGVRRKYIHHGTSRKVENMGSRTKKDAKAND